MKKHILRLIAVLLICAQLCFLFSCNDTQKAPNADPVTTNGESTLLVTPPTTDAPTTDAPTTDAPTTDAPTTNAPTTDAPTTNAPTTNAPTTNAPTTDAPTTDAPTTDAPTTDAPTTNAPTTDTQTQPNQIKNIILIIGDGMGIEHISAGQLAGGKDFGFTDWQFTNVNTDSVNSSGQGPVMTDSAAGGTALASGELTVNGYVGKNHNGANVSTILDKAANLNKSTGVVTTDTLYGATPGAFSAHNISRNNSQEIFLSQLNSDVNLLCGTKDPITSNTPLIIDAGYEYCDDFSELEETFTFDKTYWQLDLATTSASVRLCDVAVKALDYLNQDEDGFVLMIEQAHIDKYSHSNDFAGMVASMNSLNDTVEAILAWLGDRTDTAILITADHETGGLTVSTEDMFSKTYHTEDGVIYYNWSTGNHTNSKVGLFVYGVQADFSSFRYYSSEHLIKNIDVYNLMYDILYHPIKYGSQATP